MFTLLRLVFSGKLFKISSGSDTMAVTTTEENHRRRRRRKYPTVVSEEKQFIGKRKYHRS